MSEKNISIFIKKEKMARSRKEGKPKRNRVNLVKKLNRIKSNQEKLQKFLDNKD